MKWTGSINLENIIRMWHIDHREWKKSVENKKKHVHIFSGNLAVNVILFNTRVFLSTKTLHRWQPGGGSSGVFPRDITWLPPTHWPISWWFATWIQYRRTSLPKWWEFEGHVLFVWVSFVIFLGGWGVGVVFERCGTRSVNCWWSLKGQNVFFFSDSISENSLISVWWW